jgi:hypothetical protein
MRVLLVLALRGERRSFCKSVRLILFPLETNKPTKSCGGKQRARERRVFYEAENTVRSSRGETTREEGLEKVKF